MLEMFRLVAGQRMVENLQRFLQSHSLELLH